MADSGSAMAQPMDASGSTGAGESSSQFWDDLLEFIDDRRVIPIIGPELLRVRKGDQDVLLYADLARRLAEKLRLSTEGLDDIDALNKVMCRHLEKGGRREDVYPRIRSLMKDTVVETPEPLRKLARIRHFDLFVSTTFDSWLEQAINQERFNGSPGAVSIPYAPNNVQDIPCEMNALPKPTVFQLMGRLSAAPDYVITEEDTLEFLYAMQSEKNRPELLFDELKHNHLLLIGNSFPDWLTRFFMRLTKGGRLSGPRDWQEIVADKVSCQDKNLVMFLRNFSYHTQIFAEGTSVDFVDRLVDGYLKRHPPTEKAAPVAESAGAVGPGEMRPGAVFLSYCSQDLDVAQRIRDALDAAGVEVWFDKRHLEGGDDFNLIIRRNIRTCSLFMPVISANTRARQEGYFRLEWRLAAERALQIDDSIPFIIPIGIDDTPESELAIVPPKFLGVQWSRLANGQPTATFTERVVRLVREYYKRDRRPGG